MKINFTKEEYRLLLEVLYLSDWVMHAHVIKEEDYHVEHKELRKKLLSYYEEMDAKDIIEHEDGSDDYYESSEFDHDMHEKFINVYDENTFWYELIDRLAMRDIIRKMGVDKYQALDGMERVARVEEMKEYYANEFEQHGLKNIDIHHEDRVKRS